MSSNNRDLNKDLPEHLGHYEKLGASASKAGLHRAMAEAGLSDSHEYFSQMLPDVAGDPNYYSFLHCDGAGTKAIVAYLFYKSGFGAEVFSGLAQDALVMNLDDIFAVGTPEHLMLANAIARNSRLIGDDILGALLASYRSLAEELRAHGISITLAGGETADCGDVVRTLVVDAVMTGRLRRDHAISPRNIVPGDVIVGLSSTGKTTYEKAENSGISSNGLTLARHALLSKESAARHPEVLAPEIDPTAAYSGPFLVTDTAPGLSTTVGEALLSPTRTYAPVLREIYAALGKNIHGVIHLTGGGQTKVLRFGSGLHFIKNNLFPTPPLFDLIATHGRVPLREMYQVFNMGHRMELYLQPRHAEEIIALAKKFSLDAKIVGEVAPSKTGKNHLTVESGGEKFEYQLT